MPSRRALVVLLAVFALTSQKASAADWMRLQTVHFTLEGDVGAGELKMMALRLEQFRQAIGKSFPSAKLVTPAPVTVLVINHASDLKPISPRFQGKPIELAGFATTSPIGSSIVICMEYREQAYSVAYHEYGHLLINNGMLGLPLWVQEGLAEFYGTIEVAENGSNAVIGKPIPDQEFVPLRDRLLPMSELLAADHDSKLYNVSNDRSLFYAQSWALVHYLLLGDPDRSRQFTGYLQRLATGAPAATAFTDSFPNAGKLESELTEYVRKFSIRIAKVTFTDRVTGATDYTIARMTPAEVHAAMGLELAEQRRFVEAQARFEQAIKIAPETASAQTGLGVALAMQDRTVDALRALRKGAELAPGDALAHFAFGYGAQLCMSAECLPEQGGRETARRELQRAVDILPQFPEALALLGYIESVTGGDLASAERHLIQAITFLPGRDDYRITLGQVYMNRREYVKAQATLGPLAAASSGTSKARARQLLGDLAERMRAAAQMAPTAAESEPPVPPAGATTRPAAGATPPENAATPIFRALAGTERRLEGVLETILCPSAGVVVVMHDAAGVHRFSAPAITDIDFITYRDDLRKSIGCGPAPAGLRVYVTYRPPKKGETQLAAWIEGRVVAIEFLPKAK